MLWWPRPPWNCSTMGRPLRCRLGGSKNSGICWRHSCDRSEKAQYHPSRTAPRVDRDRGGSDPLAGSTHDRPRSPRLCRLRGERGPAFPSEFPRSAGTRKRPKPTSRREEVTAHDRGDLASTYQSLPSSWDTIPVRREPCEVLVFSGCESHPATGSLQPVAIGAAVEVTKPSEPSRQTGRFGDSASRQAVIASER